jgi:hypothetical protein
MDFLEQLMVTEMEFPASTGHAIVLFEILFISNEMYFNEDRTFLFYND